MSTKPYPRLPEPSAVALTPAPFPSAPPGWIVRAVIALRQGLTRLARKVGPAELSVFEDATAVALTQMLAALVRAGIPEAVAEGPQTVEALATRCGLDRDALFRTIRGCVVKGYFQLRSDGRVEHNGRSRLLAGGTLSRAREFLLYFSSGANLAAWADFEYPLRTGKSPFDHVHGMNVWEWFERHPDEQQMFAHAMMGLSTAEAPVIAAHYPFHEVKRICDVGGGRGTLLSELLIRHPHLQGMLCDSPGVLASARDLLSARGVLDRAELVPGSFFEGVPAGADAYLLKNILHDWDDARSIAILRCVRAAASPTARLLIAEALVEHDSQSAIGLSADVQMMVACSGGRERGVADFERLLGQSGFCLGRVFRYPTISVVEALPV